MSTIKQAHRAWWVAVLLWPRLTFATNAELAINPAEACVHLSMPEAVQMALRQNRDLVKLATAHQTALLDKAQAKTEFAVRFRPTGDLSSSAGVQNRQAGLDLLKKTEWGTELSIGASVSSTDVPDSDFAARDSVHVTLAQPLFRYAGKLVNREGLERADSQIRTSLRKMELKKSDIALQVIQVYMEIHRLEQQTRVEAAALERLAKLRRLTQARVHQGRATKVDELRVESQYGEAESRARSVKEHIASLRLDLAELLGLESRVTLQLDAPPMLNATTQDVDMAIVVAWSNRLDLAQVQQDYRDVERGLRIARHMLLPDIKLVTRLENYGDGATIASASSFNQMNWSIGFQVDSEIGRGREGIAYSQAQLDERMAMEDIETTRRLVERQVRQQILALEHARAEIGLAQRNRSVAEGRLRLARRLFEMGRGDNFSVTDAEQQFQQMESAWLTARTGAVLESYRMRRVTGTLIECPPELKPQEGIELHARTGEPPPPEHPQEPQ